jgi:hypothetical protein
MGGALLDQYSLLHGAVGVVAYFWQIPFVWAILIHALFEWVENTETGMALINRVFVRDGAFGWPGAKRAADSVVNRVGDTASFAVGWGVAWGVDWMGGAQHWVGRRWAV